MDCSRINETNMMMYGERCAYTCAPGFRSNFTSFVCGASGSFELSTSGEMCVRQVCSSPAIAGANVGVACESAKFGENCTLACGSGYTLSTDGIMKAECAVPVNANYEAAPFFSIPPKAVCILSTPAPNSTLSTTLAPTLDLTTSVATSTGTTTTPQASTVAGKLVLQGTYDTSRPAEDYSPSVRSALASSCNVNESLVNVSCLWRANSARRLTLPRRLTASDMSLEADFTVTVPSGATTDDGTAVTTSSVASALDAIGSANSAAFNAFGDLFIASVQSQLGISVNVTGVTVSRTVSQGDGGVQISATNAPKEEEEEEVEEDTFPIALVAGIGGAVGGIACVALSVCGVMKMRKSGQE